MGVVWDTEWGKRRVAECPPDIAEALNAAKGLSDDLEDQIELAASLIGLPIEEVRAEAMKLMPKKPERTVSVTGRNGTNHVVVVERTTRRKINRV